MFIKNLRRKWSSKPASQQSGSTVSGGFTPQLYLALYARLKYPDTYHYALHVSSPEGVSSPAINTMKYHCKNIITVTDGTVSIPWVYEAVKVDPDSDPRIVVRILLGDVNRIDQVDSLLESVPVGEGSKEDFNCVSWVRDALLQLHQAEVIIRGDISDWESVERTALAYVNEKKQQGRFESGWLDHGTPATEPSQPSSKPTTIMPFSRLITIALLGLIAIASIPCIMILHIRVGTFDLIEAITQKAPHLLLGGPAVLRTVYSHFGPLDAQLTPLIPFFWPVVTGATPELSLFGVYMGGQLLSCLAIVVIEGERIGNAWGPIGFPTIWATSWIFIPFGFVQPVHNLIHVLFSRLGRTVGQVDANAISVNAKRMALLPVSLALGFIIPSVVVCLPSPEVLSYHSRQGFLGSWQFFAISTAVWQFILTRLISDNTINRLLGIGESPQRKAAKALRNTYRFVLVVTGFSHSLILDVVLYHAFIQSYSPSTVDPLHPLLVFQPISPFSNEKLEAFERGILSLLQYDTYFAGASSLTWALYLYSSARPDTTFASLVGKATLFTVLFGPCGAALAVMKERDEAVFADSEKNDAPKKQN
ncbi:hypothetical protein V492_01451 [Pseudogymnoascus sp. VKM F-4246]|nr:hypothetical protein V492_01451 [Pseudogymnoascus sp. VKM F-4246]